MLTAPRHSSSVGRRFGGDPLSPALARGGTFFDRTLLAALPTTYPSLAMTLMPSRGGQLLCFLGSHFTYWAVIFEVVTPEVFHDIAHVALLYAEAGDGRARDWLARALVADAGIPAAAASDADAATLQVLLGEA